VLLRRRLLEQINYAGGHQHAVDGPAGARFLEELHKAFPGGGVDVAVAVLRAVAAGRIEEHRLVGQPPVAVSRAADPPDRLATETIREREAQARVDQRRRLAGARGSDEDVPGQV